MKQPIVVINKPGREGGDGLLDAKAAQNPHKIIITLSNLFTTPLAPESLSTGRI
jgi:putative tricarboxylic transport membrane protein